MPAFSEHTRWQGYVTGTAIRCGTLVLLGCFFGSTWGSGLSGTVVTMSVGTVGTISIGTVDTI